MSDDAALLAAWRGGDQRSGRALFDRHFEALYRFFCNKVGSGMDDLIQETLLACLETGDRFRGESSFRAFLLGIARNQLLRFWRRDARDAHVDLEQVSVEELRTTPSAVASRRERDRRLLDALRRLPAELQLALELYYWEELPASERAAVLEIPEGTARSRLRRARVLLTESLTASASWPEGTSADAVGLARWAHDVRAALSLEASAS